jgi:lipopolysaccharide biosynthesis protein
LSVRDELQAAIKLIAFYLPQFHPIPENNNWWGNGFTEWTNVTKAKPLFRGHYQPHLPADLGFYDLRVPEVREAQADLARQHGIHGFCYYHYWFHGKRLLERPFNEVLSSGKPDFPFCLCWANESWGRRWDGLEKQILLEQTYSPDDDLAHIRSLLRAFDDKRYIRVAGKPIFLVYRIGSLPNASATADVWREEAFKAGIGDIFLCTVESNFPGSRVNPLEIGFDAAVEFQPDLPPRSALTKIKEKIMAAVPIRGAVKYDTVVNYSLSAQQPGHPRFRCVTPSWDNTARRKSLVLVGSTPEKYRRWLKEIVSRPSAVDDERIVFINAWNEWAEGNHLEPCQKWGRGYLEATRDALIAGTNKHLEFSSIASLTEQ